MYRTSLVPNRGQSALTTHPVSRVYQRGRAAHSTQSTGQRQRANNSTRNRLAWSPDCRPDRRPVVSVSAEASNPLETQSSTMSGADGNAPSPALQPGSVVVLTTIGCPYCKRAKAMLKEQGVSYSEIDLSMDRELLQEVKKMTGRSTVPQVFIGSKLVGGADELKAAVEAKELPELLKKAKESGEGLPAQLSERLNVTSGKPTGLAPPNRLTPERFAQMKDVAARMKASKSLLQRAKVGRMQAESVFKGSDLLKWLQDEKLVEDSQQAIEMAEDLKKAQVMTAVDDSCEAWVSTAWHRLVADAPKPKKAGPMNAHYNWFGTAREGSMVANALREFILRLYDKHLAPDGKAVDYKALATDPEFQAYVDATAELQKVRVEEMPSREERISFFVNIYNALVIHATAVLGAPDGLFDRLRFFSSIEYIIGGYPYSCDDIEHGILRDNAVSPASLGALVGLPILSRPWFKRSDPRLAFKVGPEDPRIHFGLVCGAKSCPPIKLYTPDNLDEGLQAAATAFCEAEVDIDRSNRTVTMSKIFKWYGGDFGSSQRDQLKAIAEFLSPEKKQEMLAMLECDGNVSVRFKHYDWAVNSK